MEELHKRQKEYPCKITAEVCAGWVTPYLKLRFNHIIQVDTHRLGYPRFAALLSVHPAFQNFRRFARLRMRLLLLKQDEISVMEEQLDSIDLAEQRTLFLGSARRDTNTERKAVLENLRICLSEYDSMLKEYNHALDLTAADKRNVGSIKNWIDGTGCIHRKESHFLDMQDDLLNLTGPVDGAISRVEAFIADCASWAVLHIFKGTSVLPDKIKPGRQDLTQDERIFILGPHLRSFCRALTAWLATVILLIPVVVLFCVVSPIVRLIIIIAAAGTFLSALSMFTDARTIEIFTAGASYAAVLVVFTSASNSFRPE